MAFFRPLIGMGGDRVLAREIYDDPADLHARVDRRDNRSSRLNRD